ncbi:DUF2795 domain-containing protein [Streptomyces sp. Je 1-4]|uniref:DUF2795 domain-containing protein n=2 Tax=Streptomyces TaxID=1883 RepID=UPI00140ED48C|nr:MULTISPECIES: DUF2795 domain-containing protein [unclassified Streptomyces]QIK05331.1 DUF2795 domain-containing protein [Streptomyces sp. ID38640]UYB38531.1 DUF2795 domain-containing protein [Streptomyces sp. Je 1-4]UZQ34493.1 DUF2795 domain-containing protein [Streptomyces sp. Je 1-4] [Streptomyces sp. Je 1-4 4N24]UZQ41911.1 DUF2795 domain-containing protein [Streptomyces sp. Je 1-4] [Streptomyces sp. Je 1-4 4N24_ara]
MVMEHGTDKTGPARDDVMKKQLRGQLTAERSLRTDEEHELQPAGEDQPVAAWSPESDFRGGTPSGMTEQDVGLRSELAQHLGRSLYPADKNAIIETLRRNNAPDRLVAMAERLPAHERFGNVQSIAEAVGIATEHRHA